MTRLVLCLSLLMLSAACSFNSDRNKPLTKENVIAASSRIEAPTQAQKPLSVSKKKAGLAKKKVDPPKPKNTALAKLTKHQTKITETVAAAEPINNNDLWARLRQGFALPELNNDRVAHYERYFTHQPQNFYTMLERAKWFLPYILKEVEKHDFPTEIALLPAVESAFVPHAKSRSAASGLWQFIPSTGRLFKLEQNKWYDGRRDPVKSTHAAMAFFTQLDKRFDGNWFHSIAAYNAGGRTVELAIEKRARKGKSTDFTDLHLRRETLDYVPKLIAFRNIFLQPKIFGIKLPKLEATQRFATLDAGSQIDLNLFMNLADIDRKTFKFLNSAYYRNVTPPKGPHLLHLPIGKYENAKTILAGLSTKDRLRWAQYVVKKGDTLDSIASRHGVGVAGIIHSNKMKSKVIKPGKALLIPASAVRNAIAVSSSGGAPNTEKPAAEIRVATASTSTSTSTSTIDNKLTHKVRSGDTLWAIAQRYGVKVAQISRWNQISKSRTLRLGQKLTIYTRS